MPCSPSLAVSPGYLALIIAHTSQGVQHHMRIRLRIGADPNDPVTMLLAADGWAAAWKNIVSNNFTAQSYATYGPDGSAILTGSLTAPVIGVHGGAVGADDWVSKTMTVTGRGIPLLSGRCVGEARNVIFIGATYNFTPKQKFVPASSDITIATYINWLASGVQPIWADYWGQGAGVRGNLPVQVNAAIQRRIGS